MKELRVHRNIIIFLLPLTIFSITLLFALQERSRIRQAAVTTTLIEAFTYLHTNHEHYYNGRPKPTALSDKFVPKKTKEQLLRESMASMNEQRDTIKRVIKERYESDKRSLQEYNWRLHHGEE